jgi:hypothetical protein
MIGPARRASGQRELLELRCKSEAADRAMAVIEFALDGTVLSANEN